MERCVLITGVSTGIGLAVTQRLLADGVFDHVYGSVRRAADAEGLRVAYPDRFTGLVFDVTDAEARAAGVARIESDGRQLTALINNAGIALSGPLELLEEEEYRRQFEVNVFGLLGVTQACLPHLHRAREAGVERVRIINISSVSGIITSPFTAIYSASKFAVESLTDGLRRELLPFGIDVISVAPGPIKTPIWQKATSRKGRYTGTRYEPLLANMGEYIKNAEADALPASEVATAVVEALTAKKPAPFVMVMKKKWLIGLVRRLPKRMVDRLTSKRLREARRY